MEPGSRGQHGRWTVAFALGVLFAGAGVVGAGPAGGSCAGPGPSLSVSRSVVPVGATVDITGAGLVTACNDTGGPGPLLGSPPTGIRVRVVQDGVATLLARVDTNVRYLFVVRVTVPSTLHAGPAEIRASRPGHATVATAIQLVPGTMAPAPSVPPTVLVGSISHSGTGTVPERAWFVGGLMLVVAVAVGVTVFVVRRRRVNRA